MRDHSVRLLTIWLIGLILVISLYTVIVILLMPRGNRMKMWIPASAYCVGVGWILLFLYSYTRAVEAGGVGLSASYFVLVALNTLAASLVAGISFPSAWRLLALVPLIPTVYTLFPIWKSMLGALFAKH